MDDLWTKTAKKHSLASETTCQSLRSPCRLESPRHLGNLKHPCFRHATGLIDKKSEPFFIERELFGVTLRIERRIGIRIAQKGSARNRKGRLLKIGIDWSKDCGPSANEMQAPGVLTTGSIATGVAPARASEPKLRCMSIIKHGGRSGRLVVSKFCHRSYLNGRAALHCGPLRHAGE
jgi:hypothetical protein